MSQSIDITARTSYLIFGMWAVLHIRFEGLIFPKSQTLAIDSQAKSNIISAVAVSTLINRSFHLLPRGIIIIITKLLQQIIIRMPLFYLPSLLYSWA